MPESCDANGENIFDSTIKIEFITSLRFALIVKVKIRSANQTRATQNGTTPGPQIGTNKIQADLRD